jgi:hypothetical protein
MSKGLPAFDMRSAESAAVAFARAARHIVVA